MKTSYEWSYTQERRTKEAVMWQLLFCVRLAAHVSFARHGRALAGESPEHAQVVGNV